MKPTPETSRDGRASPIGIPVLYLAKEKETALAEVRPWKKAIISMAQFKIARDLVVVDCRTDNPFQTRHFTLTNNPDPLSRETIVWRDVDLAFSEPVDPNDCVIDYIPTQIIAESFRHAGYAGLMFNSSATDGNNLVLFSLNDAMLVGQRQLYACDDVTVTCRFFMGIGKELPLAPAQTE